MRNAAMQEQISRDGLQGTVPEERNALDLHDDALAHMQGVEAAINHFLDIEEQSAYRADVLDAACNMLDKRIAEASGRAREAQARARAKAG